MKGILSCICMFFIMATSSLLALPVQAFVANSQSDDVTVIDTTTLATTTVSVGVNPCFVTITPNGKEAYVANNGDDTVTIINVATKETSTVPVGSYPYFITFDLTGNTAYVTNWLSNNITLIDIATHVTTTVPVGANPFYITFTVDGKQAYVYTQANQNITVVNLSTLSTSTLVPSSWPYMIAISPLNDYYIGCYFQDYPPRNHPVPPTANAVPLPQPMPVSYAFTPNDQKYEINYQSNTVTRTSSVFPPATIQVGQGPWCITMAPAQ